MIHLLIKGIEEGAVDIIDSQELTTKANDIEVNSGENINRQQPGPDIEKVRLVNLGQCQDSNCLSFHIFRCVASPLVSLSVHVCC